MVDCWKLSLLITWTCLVLKGCGGSKVVVKTSLGKIQGVKRNGINTFLGIPFAEPPVGSLRFQPTTLVSAWAPSTVRATAYKPDCMQSLVHNVDVSPSQAEDCLYMNIWAPSGDSSRQQPYPVMLWVYGGAFQQGGASKREYVGEQLAQRGVVVVSFNYRVGALGFAVCVEEGLFGNYGLHDQQLAMEFTHSHIAEFGGDPQRVTVFGESAGAMSLGLHMLTRSRGTLFQSIILQSNPFGYKYRSVTIANFLGQALKRGLDCPDLACLLSEPAEEIIHVQDTLHGVPRSVGDFFTWGPVLTDERFIDLQASFKRGRHVNITVQQPLQTLAELQRFNLPIVLGLNRHEGHMFVYAVFPAPMHKYVYWSFVFTLFRGASPSVLRLYSPVVEQFASEGRGLDSQSNLNLNPNPQSLDDYRPVLANILTDYMFRCPARLAATLLTLTQSVYAPVYVYEFSFPTRTPGYPACTGLACHTAELPYVFDQMSIIRETYSMGSTRNTSTNKHNIFGDAAMFFSELVFGTVDQRVSALMADLWTNFAKFHHPTRKNPHRRTEDKLYKPFKGISWPEWWPERADFIANHTSTDNPKRTKPEMHLLKKEIRRRVSSNTYADITFPFQVEVAQKDCVCEFWNSLAYKY